jgi:hypothetical protein
MAEKSAAACDNAPSNNIVQDLAINNTLINRLFTRIALKTWGKLYKSNDLCSPISKKMIVKTGPRVDLTEAATMKFVADNTSVPVPKVYCSFVHKDHKYILMESIKGEPIGRVLGLEHDVQQKVFGQLKRMMDELRSLHHQTQEFRVVRVAAFGILVSLGVALALGPSRLFKTFIFGFGRASDLTTTRTKRE